MTGGDGVKTPSRPALRYHGSKWLLAQWISSHFPPHECYVECYGGGAGTLLQKARSWLEVYNDLDHQVVNYFRVLRERPEELVRLIRLTPYSLIEWELAQDADSDPLEAARRLYIRSFQGIAGPTAQWRTGWRRQKLITKSNGQEKMTPAACSFMGTEHLFEIAERLRGVEIDCKPALEIIERYDSSQTLFYLDPPYPSSTRSRGKKQAYAYEMTDEQHQELARAVHKVHGMVLISGYQCEMYDELYHGWPRVEKEARTNSQYNTAMESLWISPNAMANKLPLFRNL